VDPAACRTYAAEFAKVLEQRIAEEAKPRAQP
jgi:hypothetical protein